MLFPQTPATAAMALDGCGAFCKYTLVLFNVLFAVSWSKPRR